MGGGLVEAIVERVVVVRGVVAGVVVIAVEVRGGLVRGVVVGVVVVVVEVRGGLVRGVVVGVVVVVEVKFVQSEAYIRMITMPDPPAPPLSICFSVTFVPFVLQLPHIPPPPPLPVFGSPSCLGAA